MSSFEESRDSADHVASFAGQGAGIYMSLFGCEFNFGGTRGQSQRVRVSTRTEGTNL